MSEYHVVKVCFTDTSILLQSLEEMGYNPIVNEEAQNLYGYQGDQRKQKAHIVIPRNQVGSLSNDVGFEKTNDGYIMHASEYDYAWRNGDKVKRLNKLYAENKIKKYVNSTCNCNILSREENKNGKVEIHIRIS